MKKMIITYILMLVIIGQAAAVTIVGIIDSKGAKGDNVKVPINIVGASNLGAMDIVLSYDSSVLKGIDASGSAIGSNTLIDSKETHPGTMRISFTDSKGISGNGTLLEVVFEVTGDTGSSTEISIDATGYDEKSLEVPLKILPGYFKVENAGISMMPAIMTIVVVLLVLVFAIKKSSEKK